MKNEEVKNQELHYLNSLFVCRLDEVSDNIEDMDGMLFDELKEAIIKIVDEEIFEQIFAPIEKYSRALSDMSHIAGMKLMLHSLACLER